MKELEDGTVVPTWERLEEIRALPEDVKQAKLTALVGMRGGDTQAATRMFQGPSEEAISKLKSVKHIPEAVEGFDIAFGVGAADAVLGTSVLDHAGDVLKGLARGPLKAVDEFVQFMTPSVAEDNPYGVDRADVEKLQASNGPTADALPAPEYMSGKFAEGISQFATGYLASGPALKPALKPAQALSKLSQFAVASVRGAIADGVFFDPKDPAIIEVARDFGMDENALTEWLASADDDDRRLYKAAEGIVPGILVEGVVAGFKLLKSTLKNNTKEIAKNSEALSDALDKLRADNGNADVSPGAPMTREEASQLLEVRPTVEGLQGSDVAEMISKETDEMLMDATEFSTNPEVQKAYEKQLLEQAAELEGRGIDLSNDTRFMSQMEKTIEHQLDLHAPELSKLMRRDINRSDTLKSARKFTKGYLDALKADRPADYLLKMIDDLTFQDAAAANVAVMTLKHEFGRVRTLRREIIRDLKATDPSDPLIKIAEKQYDEVLAKSLELYPVYDLLGSLSGHTLKARAYKPGKTSLGVKLDKTLEEAEYYRPIKEIVDEEVAAAAPKKTKEAKKKSKRLTDPERSALEKLKSLRELDVPVEDAEDIAKALLENLPKTEGKIISTVKQDHDAFMRIILEAASEVRTSLGLLSAPTTYTINLVSGALNTVAAPMIEATGAALSGKGEQGAIRAVSQYVGMAKSTKHALKEFIGVLFKNEYLHGTNTRAEELIHLNDSFSSKQLGKLVPEAISKNTPGIIKAPVALTVDTVGHTARLFGRLLVATDTALRRVNHQGIVLANAVEEAHHAKLTGKAFDKYVNDAYAKGLEHVDPVAASIAERRLFVDDFNPGSKYAGERMLGTVQRTIAEHPVLRVAPIIDTPFFRTPMRIIEQSLRLTPGPNLALGRFRDDFLGNNGPLAAYKARGEMFLGISLVTLAAHEALEGNITGLNAQDRPTRELDGARGDVGQSFIIEGKQYPYGRVEPFATPIRSVSTLVSDVLKYKAANAHRYVSDAELISEGLAAYSKGIAASLTTAPFTEPAKRAMRGVEVLSDPDRSFLDDFLGREVGKYLGSYVPNIAKKYNSMEREFAVADYGPSAAESFPAVSALLNQFYMSAMPDIQDTRVDVLGRPVKNVFKGAPSMWMFAGIEMNNDPILTEMKKITEMSDVVFQRPSRKMYGVNLQNILFKDTEDGTSRPTTVYAKLMEKMHDNPDLEASLEDVLTSFITSSEYQQLSWKLRGDTMNKIITAYRDASVGYLLQKDQRFKDYLTSETLLEAEAILRVATGDELLTKWLTIAKQK